MKSTMMNFPLTLEHVLERAGKLFAKSEIVSRLPDRTLHRHTYADFHRRARALGAPHPAGQQRVPIDTDLDLDSGDARFRGIHWRRGPAKRIR